MRLIDKVEFNESGILTAIPLWLLHAVAPTAAGCREVSIFLKVFASRVSSLPSETTISLNDVI